MKLVGYSDSKSLENAIKSNTNVQSRRLRIDLAVIREMKNEGTISDVCWINGKEQIADELTKEGCNKRGICEYLMERD